MVKKKLGIVCLGLILSLAALFTVHIFLRHKASSDDEITVKLELGELTGRKRVSVLNSKPFLSFEGIPYAKPPVGVLRFKDPEPIQQWSSTIDATKPGNMCLQKDVYKENSDSIPIFGAEDCLYLNVYTQQYSDVKRLYPVIVYFHGGGFTYGSGNYGADYLIEHDVVVVTVNYRIGALGFLSLANDDIPGNAGLKDQVLALRWIKDHIQIFNGNPNMVTISGTSAGSASVQYHMLSPLSKGLFHKAIMLSGSVLNPWAFENNPVKKAIEFGKILGIQTDNITSLAENLKKISYKKIVDLQLKAKNKQNLKRCIGFPFMPSIEKPSPNSFLTEHPEAILKKGTFYQVPTIFSAVENEGVVAFFRLDAMNYIENDTEGFIPPELNIRKTSSNYKGIDEKLRAFYFNNNDIGYELSDNIIDLCGDVEFYIGIQKSINYFLKHSTQPVYVIKFNYDGKFSFFKSHINIMWPKLILPKGPGHTDDTPYIFRDNQSDEIKTDISNEIKIINNMTSLLTSFAKHEDLYNSNDFALKQIKDISYLSEVGDSLSIFQDTLLTQRKYELWNSIYEDGL